MSRLCALLLLAAACERTSQAPAPATRLMVSPAWATVAPGDTTRLHAATLAGDSGKGYYSYTIGTWHIISLNSNIPATPGSPQEQWLRADLAGHPARCTLAYWHHPRFSSGSEHGSTPATQPLWQALYDAGADVVVSGHEHDYERFAPQTAAGALDTARGIREFVAGTGGMSHYAFGPPIANSEVRQKTTFGVLQLTLKPGRYDWRFIPVAGGAFRDAGSGSCH